MAIRSAKTSRVTQRKTASSKKTKTVARKPAKRARAPRTPRVAALAPASACLFPTALGNMAIAWREDKIVGVFLPEESDEKLLAQVRKRTRSPQLAFSPELPAFVGHVAAQIRAHLRGEPQSFTFEHLDLPSRGPFVRKVYELSISIPNGQVLTYREMAEKAGSPKAFRAVGQAMATNPFPIVIPCHRVVGATRGAGGFSAHGGLDTKERILKIENKQRE